MNTSVVDQWEDEFLINCSVIFYYLYFVAMFEAGKAMSITNAVIWGIVECKDKVGYTR